MNFSVDSREVYRAKLLITGHETGPIRFDIDPSRYQGTSISSHESDVKAPESVMFGMSGTSARAGGASRLEGTVYLADGVTPALGAQALYFPAHQPNPMLLALADALGKLQPRGLWYTGNSVSSQDGPDAATVVASLPGKCGATVQAASVQPGKSLHLKLPPANKASGDVTIAGKAPADLPGVIHVVAAYESVWFLQRYLSLETTADADGRFTFSGLTQATTSSKPA